MVSAYGCAQKSHRQAEEIECAYVCVCAHVFLQALVCVHPHLHLCVLGHVHMYGGHSGPEQSSDSSGAAAH